MEEDKRSEHDFNLRCEKRRKIMDSILDCVGCTPLVRLNKIPQSMGIECEVLVKCEFLNPGGSVKDRIGKNMLLKAERDGVISPGNTLIEPTSGNTGLGIAMTAAVKGYNSIITMPEKMSNEKADVLTALGAQIYRTPTEAAFDHYDSHLELAKRLNHSITGSHILDQYINNNNPDIHYQETGEEIWQQCSGKVDVVVAGVGTGGTITGISKKLKEYNPQVKIIGVDPLGSILAQPEHLNEQQPIRGQVVEGVGYDFIPDVLARHYVDEWIKSNDEDTFPMARRLLAEEGILSGGSSGGNLFYALQYAKQHQLGKDKRMVVVLPDGIRNYMTKFLQNEWMVKYNYYPPSKLAVYPDSQLANVQFHQLGLAKEVLQDINKCTVHQARQLFKHQKVIGLHQDGQLQCAVHKNKFIRMVIKKNLKADDLLKDKGCVDKDIPIFSVDQISVEQIQKLLEKNESVFIRKDDDYYQVNDEHIMEILKL